MATNLALDDHLIDEAKKIGHHRTKRDAVNEALAEYIDRRKRMQIFDFAGKIEMIEGYDYKAIRRKA
jgi:hypothetical protein